MLFIVLKALFVLVCVFLILVILLQSGKGGDVAAAFGGSGSQSAFGPRGAQKPLEKATVIAAITFMLMALLFSLPGFNGPKSVVREGAAASTVPTPAPAASPSVSPAASASPAASPAAGASAAASASPAPGGAKASPSPAAKAATAKASPAASPAAAPKK